MSLEFQAIRLAEVASFGVDWGRIAKSPPRTVDAAPTASYIVGPCHAFDAVRRTAAAEARRAPWHVMLLERCIAGLRQ